MIHNKNSDSATGNIPDEVDVLLYIPASRSSFSIGLVKTESDFILRSVETDIERWILVVVVISVDAYPFLAVSDLTCQPEDTGIDIVWLHWAVW